MTVYPPETDGIFKLDVPVHWRGCWEEGGPFDQAVEHIATACSQVPVHMKPYVLNHCRQSFHRGPVLQAAFCKKFTGMKRIDFMEWFCQHRKIWPGHLHETWAGMPEEHKDNESLKTFRGLLSVDKLKVWVPCGLQPEPERRIGKMPGLRRSRSRNKMPYHAACVSPPLPRIRGTAGDRGRRAAIEDVPEDLPSEGNEEDEDDEGDEDVLQPEDPVERERQLVEELRAIRLQQTKNASPQTSNVVVEARTRDFARTKGMDILEHDDNGYNLLHFAANEMLLKEMADIVLNLIMCLPMDYLLEQPFSGQLAFKSPLHILATG